MSATAYRRAWAALGSEWIKLRSLRSLPIMLLVAVIFCVGLANLVCVNYVRNWSTFDAATKAGFVPLDVNLGFMVLGILFFAVLGALVVTSEYGNGMIRTTFAATPQRGLVLAAKTSLVGLLALVAAAVICLTAILSGQAVLTGHTPHVGLGDAGVLGRALGAVLYLTAGGLIGLFVGVLTRSTAVAISSVFGLFLVLPILADKLPDSVVWRHTVPYLPSNLGDALWHSHTSGLARPATAAILLPAYVVVLGAVAVVSLRDRDA